MKVLWDKLRKLVVTHSREEDDKNDDFTYIDNKQGSETKSKEVRKNSNSKMSLSIASGAVGVTTLGGTAYAVKRYVWDKKKSEDGNQSQENQNNDSRGEKGEENNYGSNANGSTENPETGEVPQEKVSGGGPDLKVIIPVVVVSVIIITIVSVIILRKVKTSNIIKNEGKENVNEIEENKVDNFNEFCLLS